jgi:hypothetical protein
VFDFLNQSANIVHAHAGEQIRDVLLALFRDVIRIPLVTRTIEISRILQTAAPMAKAQRRIFCESLSDSRRHGHA